MARMRQVKPQLRSSHVVASWPREVRYAWVLLWGYLDDSGRGFDVPKGIAGDCFPHDDDVTPKKMDNWLKRMTTGLGGKPGPLCRYEVDGIRYLHAVNWEEHQRPNRPTASRLPPCPFHERLNESDSEPDTEPNTEDSVSDSVSPHGIPTLRGLEGSRVRELEVPPTAGAPERSPAKPAAPSTDIATRDEPPTAQTLIAEWIDHCDKRPPGNVVGQVSKQLKTMLDEGIDPDDVRRGLAAWHSKALHPSTLPSVVNEAMNGRARHPPQATTDRKVADGLALAAKYDAMNGSSDDAW